MQIEFSGGPGFSYGDEWRVDVYEYGFCGRFIATKWFKSLKKARQWIKRNGYDTEANRGQSTTASTCDDPE